MLALARTFWFDRVNLQVQDVTYESQDSGSSRSSSRQGAIDSIPSGNHDATPLSQYMWLHLLSTYCRPMSCQALQKHHLIFVSQKKRQHLASSVAFWLAGLIMAIIEVPSQNRSPRHPRATPLLSQRIHYSASPVGVVREIRPPTSIPPLLYWTPPDAMLVFSRPGEVQPQPAQNAMKENSGSSTEHGSVPD